MLAFPPDCERPRRRPAPASAGGVAFTPAEAARFLSRSAGSFSARQTPGGHRRSLELLAETRQNPALAYMPPSPGHDAPSSTQGAHVKKPDWAVAVAGADEALLLAEVAAAAVALTLKNPARQVHRSRDGDAAGETAFSGQRRHSPSASPR